MLRHASASIGPGVGEADGLGAGEGDDASAGRSFADAAPWCAAMKTQIRSAVHERKRVITLPFAQESCESFRGCVGTYG
jgi:hypothetical protein